MRAADLLGCVAVDTSGQRLGRVHDIHLIRSDRGRWRVDAVTVGPAAVAYRFGYANQEVAGPMLLRAFALWLARRSRRVPWSRVRSHEPGRLLVDVNP